MSREQMKEFHLFHAKVRDKESESIKEDQIEDTGFETENPFMTDSLDMAYVYIRHTSRDQFLENCLHLLFFLSHDLS
jgi:hypothetical protein